MLNYFPKFFSNRAIILYLSALVIVSVVFFAKMLPVIWWAFGLVEVIGFFYFSNKLTRKWGNITPESFTKKILTTSLILRISWVIFSYFFYIFMTGKPFEFSAADSLLYQRIATNLADTGFGNYENVFFGMEVSDRGYGTYLGTLYMIFGNGVIIPRIIKAILGSLMCVLVYKLAKRNFGEEVGRMAAIFCMLMPNMIYYSAIHLKEAEMVFLAVWFVERADNLIRHHRYTLMSIVPTLLIAASLFFFRTILGVTALFALLTTLMFSSTRVMSWGKRVVTTIWVIVAITYFVGGRIAGEIEETWLARKGNQELSMQWRAEREGGNKLAKYASSAIFVPLIFVIPFPTIVNTPGQENQQLLHGGNYVKNILAFFVIFALVYVIRYKLWKDYLMVGSFTVGYLILIALSAFAQSERFHQPALPFLLILAAFGISKITNAEKKLFTWYMVFIFVAIVAWSWFKLAGRGMT